MTDDYYKERALNSVEHGNEAITMAALRLGDLLKELNGTVKEVADALRSFTEIYRNGENKVAKPFTPPSEYITSRDKIAAMDPALRWIVQNADALPDGWDFESTNSPTDINDTMNYVIWRTWKMSQEHWKECIKDLTALLGEPKAEGCYVWELPEIKLALMVG